MEKKNLDRLFQEQFRDFEVAPPTDMWPRIEAELRQRKRRVIPLWYKLSGVAALFVIGLGLYAVLSDNSAPNAVVVNPNPSEINQNPADSSNQNPDLQNVTPQTAESVAHTPSTEEQTNPTQNGGNPSTTEGNVSAGDRQKSSSGIAPGKGIGSVRSAVATIESQEKEKREKLLYTGSGDVKEKARPSSQLPIKNQNESAIAGGKTNSESASPTQSNAKTQESAAEQKNTSVAQSHREKTGNQKDSHTEKPAKADPLTINPASGLHAVVQVKAEPQPDSTAVATVEPNALEELLNEKENNVTAGEQKINRWQITSSVAPIYFSSVSNGSPIDSRLSSTSKTYKPSVSYGAGVSYAVNKRLSVRTGINSLAFEYSTNDLIFYQTPNARQLENVKPNAPGSLIEIDRNPGMLTVAGVVESKAGAKRFDGVLNQRTGYVEVPMEMTYRLVDRKFGVNLIGGVSTLFLNENTVSLESPGMELVIGEADNLNRVHFSTNVGVGFNYRFLKSFEARFDPMFKYQINTYSNNAGNFKPYFFGLYTGISYRF